MNFNRLLFVSAALLLAGTSTAWAIPTIAVEDATVPAGTTSTVITITHTEASPNSTQAGSFNVTYDTAKLSSNAVAVCAGLVGTWGCTMSVPGTIVFASSYVELGSLGNLSIDITFDLTNADVPSVNPLNITNPLYLTGDVELTNPNVDPGSITIQPPPEPDADFTPNPGGTLNIGSVVQNATDISANVQLNNVGDTGSQLDASCSVTTNPTVFSISNASVNDLTPAGGTHNFTVTCDSAQAIQTHNGQLTCTHNGNGDTDSSPVLINLQCSITEGPQPAYSSNPIGGTELDFGGAATEQGDPPPTDSIVVTNSGDANGLTFTCTDSVDPSNAFSVTNGAVGEPGLNIGASSAPVVVSCDSNLSPDTYTGTLSCSHNGSNDSPVTYPLSCEISPPGQAIFSSDPIPGSDIDLTNGTAVPEGASVPSKSLTFYNIAEEGDSSLEIHCSPSGDTSVITWDVNDVTNGSVVIAPGGSWTQNFSCDTTTANDYEIAWSCEYDLNLPLETAQGELSDVDGTAQYTVSCDVREPEAQVVITPAPNTPQTKTVPPGGSTNFSFDFTEDNDEGEDAALHDCWLDDGSQGFSINPYPVEATIGSGETVNVNVDFTDPTGSNTRSDTLTCEFSDSDDDDTWVSWLLTVNIGGDARITVLKDFTDGNPGDVTVELDCNTGLILDQDKDISEDGIGVTFVITDYTAGILDCYVSEQPVAGYSADYEASGDSDSESVDDPNEDAGCYFTDMEGGVENLCVITNSPDPVDVVITKEWLYPGSSDSTSVSNEFEILLWCENAEIAYDDEFCGVIFANAGVEVPELELINYSCKWLEGEGNKVFNEKVTPYDWPGGECWAVEVDVDQAVEVDNGCASGLEVSAGSGDACTITNTVFFEGIPTLSQYGMLLMALLMMGVGFVAVRRIS